VCLPVVNVAWPSDGLIKANVDQTGFYRVNYDLSDWQQLSEYLRSHVGTANNVSTAIFLVIINDMPLSSFLSQENIFKLTWFYIIQ